MRKLLLLVLMAVPASAANHLDAEFPADGVTVRTAAGNLHLRVAGYGEGALITGDARVEYRRDAFTEWYANDVRGLEQGFTLYHHLARPIELEVTGDLLPALAGDAITFQKNGHAALRYSGLHAWDAAGRTLPSRLEVRGKRIRILVDDRDARYPVTIDPWIQQQELLAADGAAGSCFGQAAAINGSTAIIGAPGGCLFSADTFPGSAYVFVNSGSGWTLQQELTAPDGVAGDFFGYSVAVNGDTAVIGTHKNTVDGSGHQGSAYVFVRDGTSWTMQQELKASDGGADDNFGTSVGVSGDTAVIGKPNQTCCQGAIYIFTRSGTSWTQQQEILAADGYATDDDQFGTVVAIDQDTVVACADSRNLDGGYFYVFDGTSWNFQQEVVPPCDSVALSGDTAIFGTGLAASVYTRTGTVWTLQQQFTASDLGSSDNFGRSVALDGDTALIGNPAHQVGSNLFQGAAYLFIRSGGVWTQEQELLASDGAQGNDFGFAVALSGGQAIIGAKMKKIGSNSYQGAAYVFQGPQPLLSVIPTHTGPWTRGATATIDITVGNTGTGPTTGVVTVTDALPAGMTLNSGSATNGWNCTGTTTVTCTTSDSINIGGSSPFTYTVSLDNTVADQVTNTVTASGGGDPNTHVGSDGPSAVAGTNLSIVLGHAYRFFQGETGATYTITVTNNGASGLGSGPGATVGTVSVSVTLPASTPTSLTLTSIGGGSNWSCSTSSATCTSNTALATAATATFTATVNIAADAPTPVTSQASVSGGGAPTVSTSNPTSVAAFSACDVNTDRVTNVQDVQLLVNQALGMASESNDLNADGEIGVTDIQIVSNAALGGVCTVS